jgi:hypothetical protein
MDSRVLPRLEIEVLILRVDDEEFHAPNVPNL